LLALVFATLAFSFLSANYGVFSLCVTGYVVFLLAIVGQPDAPAVHDRLIATGIGGAIATVAMLVWPTWEAEVVSERLADLLEAQRGFAARVLTAYVDPGARDFEAIHDAQIASRQARTAAEASVARVIAEPGRARRLRDETLLGLLAASRRFALEILALDARIAHLGDRGVPELGRFRDALLATLDRNAGVVRADGEAATTPDLREVYRAAFAGTVATGDADDAFLRSAGDELVDSVDTMSALVGSIGSA